MVRDEECDGVTGGNENDASSELASDSPQVVDGLLRRSLIDVPNELTPAVPGVERGGPRIGVHQINRDPQASQTSGDGEAAVMRTSQDQDGRRRVHHVFVVLNTQRPDPDAA